MGVSSSWAAGLNICVMAYPVSASIHEPAKRSPAKTKEPANPMRAPMYISLRAMKTYDIRFWGIAISVGGSVGKRIRLRKNESAALRRAGTSSSPRIGMRNTIMLIRINTSSQISIWATVKSCKAGIPLRAVTEAFMPPPVAGPEVGLSSSQQRGNHLKQFHEKTLEKLKHPGQEYEQRHSHGQEFGYEGQGHFVDLRGRLENAHDQTHDKGQNQHGPAQYQHHHQGFPTQIDYHHLAHNPAVPLSAEAEHQLLHDQVPSVHQYEQDEFEGRGNHDRRKHHHAHGHEHGRDDHVYHQERDVNQEPDDEGGSQLADAESRYEGEIAQVVHIAGSGRAAYPDHQRQILFIDLPEHEFAHRGHALFQRDLVIHFLLKIGLQGLLVYPIERRPHDEKGEEKGQAHQHLVRWRVLGPQSLLEEGQHHHHPREAGHHDENGRGQAEDGEHGHQLEGDRDVLGAGGLIESHGEFGQGLRLGGQRREQQHQKRKCHGRNGIRA